MRGVTEELARGWLILVIPTGGMLTQLRIAANVIIDVDLPCSGLSTPRVLECAATVSCVRLLHRGVRVTAVVHRMRILDRSLETARHCRPVRQLQTASNVFTAIPRLQNTDPVIPRNHLTEPRSNQGEETMSFLKKLITEEDGQDMVEYGLIIALVVVAAAGILTAFGAQITGGYTAVGTKIANDIK
jgi:pilus assembly protein Flp/PilA